MFVCVVNFLIYCPEKKVTKAKKDEVKWVAYKHQKDSAVTFNPEGIDWTSFQKIVRIESRKSFSTMPSMIEEQSKSNLPSITWRAFILRNNEYAKGAPMLGPTASDDANSSFQDYKDLDVYLDEIYKTYGINADINCKIPCYPHPTDKKKYILLTPDTVELWEKELMRKTPGISIDSPQSHFKYKTRKTATLASNGPSLGAV
ncbi:hypothetical protein PCANC_04758 [Puccinia coronata f. sp. avenae]|uniref:Uncharacterized protein n=1 Tax=Puccinia coronata f. sp. avenae TaxID=200324 RepID=A0A2N5VWN8_9BASI|nr:hypothetical protein PCANC_22105 [Puccinia coronata f. sp. avenae]PLW54404.1 hypothetical protein PCANC_04758 [Puccinia coronata f. sp. avenae]